MPLLCAGALQSDQLQQADLRNGVAIAAGGHDQGRDDGERERDLDPESRPQTGAALNIDDAADLFDVGLDHVHPDAAARDVAHLRGGGKPGQKDQVLEIAVAHARDLLGRDQAFFERLVPDRLQVDSVTVVRDLDVHLAAFVEGAQQEPSLCWLLGGQAVGRALHAVIDAVADQVGQGILDRLDDGLVELGLAALHLDAHLLAAHQRQIAHDARQLLPDIANGLHARLHDAGLQLGGDEVQPLRRRGEIRIRHAGRDLKYLVAGQVPARRPGSSACPAAPRRHAGWNPPRCARAILPLPTSPPVRRGPSPCWPAPRGLLLSQRRPARRQAQAPRLGRARCNRGRRCDRTAVATAGATGAATEATGGGAVGTAASGDADAGGAEPCRRLRVAIRAEQSWSRSLPSASIPLRISRMVSAVASSAVTMSGESSISSSRTLESRFSATWATDSSLEKPIKPHAPFTVWTRRKTVANKPGVFGFFSRAISSRSRKSRFSLASTTNSVMISSCSVALMAQYLVPTIGSLLDPSFGRRSTLRPVNRPRTPGT